MLNLLIISLSRAKKLKLLWNNAHGWTDTFCIIGFLLFIIIVLWCVAPLLSHYTQTRLKHPLRYALYWLGWITSVGLCILTLGTAFVDMPSISSLYTKNIGAINNVGCYYRMKHLRHIYPKLPCKPHKKICKTNSINKATEYRTASKYTFTKAKATKEYAELKRAYRHASNTYEDANHVNNTKSLHPHAPKWWNYIWNAEA